ncbi:MAG: class I SAM-dependent methyltransferase [Thermoplasmata archaeon]|nr:class I SAM-dependent methyltransferase [Thermoplasmata archaeon]
MVRPSSCAFTPAVLMSGMYSDLAEYYDAVYSGKKDYRKESDRIVGLARRNGRSGGREWLDVACGTGQHIRYLSPRFRCTGVDASPQMLRIARRRNPGVRFVRGDMRSFRLRRQFDVVSCLFSAIGHVNTLSALRRTIECFVRHLKPGGVVLIEPWLTRKTFFAGRVHLLTVDTPDLKIARATYSMVHGSQSILRMHYLIAERGRGVRHTAIREVSGLFDHSTTLRLLRNAGLQARFLRRGFLPDRGLFVGVRPVVPPNRPAPSRSRR